jgi:four helix bundle protein
MEGKMKENLLFVRTKKFAVCVVKFAEKLPYSRAGKVYADQVIRSGTSTYLNYRAAKQARSTAEFISKLGVSQEESDETVAWLELIGETIQVEEASYKPLCKEAGEIYAMLTASLKTAKQNNKRH